MERTGPLRGLRVIEFAGIGPAPFAAMMLADMGADVIRIDRKTKTEHYRGAKFDVYNPGRYGVLNRGRRSIAVDLKHPQGLDVARRLVTTADALIEGFRPGVMERLELGPDDVMTFNPRLVYGRITGWGQDGPLAQAAGHDINYIALSGALNAIGPSGGAPVVPLNLVGDFGGGGLLLAYGVVCALWEAERSGRGQVVDTAMADGAALLMGMFFGMHAAGAWRQQRGTNRHDGGAHFYGVYETKDGKWIAVGANEPQFYDLLLELCGVGDEAFRDRLDEARWPELKRRLGEVFASRTRDEWCALLEGTDACFAPVLDLDEAPRHPHYRARGTFESVDGVTQPGPQPRFSGSPARIDAGSPVPGQHTRELLEELEFSAEERDMLFESGAVSASDG
jgi:alpha-methylacyl-CoA racemase